MKAASFVALLLVPLVAACDSVLGDEDGQVELSVEGEAFAAGDDVLMRVENDSDATVFYNLCFIRLDTRSGDEWIDTDRLGNLPCPAVDPFWPGLRPNRSAEIDVALPDDVPAGTYRLRMEVWEKDESGSDVATAGFQVE